VGLDASGRCRASLQFLCQAVLAHRLGGQPKHGLSRGSGQPGPEFHRVVPGLCRAFFRASCRAVMPCAA
jgi:hypothetical protein